MNPITRECQDCPDLQELLADIDCTILDLVNSKYNSVIYGVEGCCNPRLLKSLVHYKEIITARTYNPNYPCGVFSNNELLSKVRLLAYKTNCSKCPECEEIITTTTTQANTCYSYLVNIAEPTGMSELYPYSYVNCSGNVISGSISQYQALNICALRNTISINPIFTIQEYAEGCEIVPETCSCSEITNEETDPGTVPYVFSYSDCDDNVYTDVSLTKGMSTFICVKPSTLTTNFNFSMVIGEECVDSCE